MPNTRFSGTAIAAASSVSRIADQRVGLADRGEVDVHALLEAPRRTRSPAARTGTAQERQRDADQQPSAPAAGSVVAPRSERGATPERGRGSGRASAGTLIVSPALPRARPRLQRVDRQQQHERRHQHHHGDRGGAGVVVLLELGDDEQRRDLGLTIGMLPAMKITEPYSPSARAKASAKPVSSAGSQDRKHHAPEGLPAVGAQRGGGLLELAAAGLRAPAAPCARRTAGR